MNGNSTARVTVEPGGAGVVAHVGLHALGSSADRLGLGDSLSSRIPWTGERMPLHDRGEVLVQMALVLAGGGESCADIEHLRVQPDLFGWVSSGSTVFRTFHEITEGTCGAFDVAMAEVRAKVWARSAATTRKGPVTLDIDASLVDVHSENEGGAPHLRGTTASTRCALRRRHRGDARRGAPSGQRRGQYRRRPRHRPRPGHRPTVPRDRPWSPGGRRSEAARKRGHLRADSAGCTEGFLTACRERNVTFYVTARQNPQVTAAVSDAVGLESVWEPARSQDGELRGPRCASPRPRRSTSPDSRTRGSAGSPSRASWPTRAG